MVRIGGGANAIRGGSADGLTWTIAGNAQGVAKLQVGKIMAATTLAVGRVLAIKRVGPNVQVTLGPSPSRTSSRKATFEAKKAALKQPLYYSTAFPTTPVNAMRTPQTVRARSPEASSPRPILYVHGRPPWVRQRPGRLSATIEFSIPKPSIDFHIVIDNGLKEASFRMNSTAALDYEIEAAELRRVATLRTPATRWCLSRSASPLAAGSR